MKRERGREWGEKGEGNCHEARSDGTNRYDEEDKSG